MKQSHKNVNRSISLLAPIILCSCAAIGTGSSEPVYNGKALSEWLMADHGVEFADESDRALAKDAIREIGTNAIPVLLDLLSTTEWSKGRVVAKLKSQDFKYLLKLPSPSGVEVIRGIAKSGFSILGTNAEPAVPELTKLLHREDTCMDAASVLAGVGPKGFAVLTNSFNDRNLVGAVVWALGTYGGGDTNAITRLLITALKDPNPIIRGNAADFLAGKDPALAVPALISMLDDKEFYPKDRTAGALARFGPAAKAAAPKLLILYTNIIVGRDKRLAKTLTPTLLDALRRTDPETAGKAEEFMLNGGPLGVVGYGWSTTPMPSGKDLIAGGSIQTTFPNTNNHVFSRAELFDPATGMRTETGSMNTAREFHTATLLRTGQVLVAGGQNLVPDGTFHSLVSAELYDPMTGKWTQTGSMNSPHPNQSAILEKDGKVRVSGSEGRTKLPDDLYDPRTGTWTMIPHQ